MRSWLALAIGLLVIAAAAGVTLSHEPLTVARENLPLSHTTLVTTTTPAGACQAHETLPRGTSAIRLGLTTDLGPRVMLQVLSGTRTLTRGAHAPGWDGASVTVPVRPVSRAFAPVKICFQLSSLNGPVSILGSHTRRAKAARAAGKPLPGRVHIEYLRSGGRSWWSMADAVSWRLGLGRAASGTWSSLLVMALAGILVVLSSWLVIREL